MFHICQLCHSPDLNFDSQNEFVFCQNCELVFRAPKESFTGKGEKDHYLKHKNGPQFQGYITFLKQAISPLTNYLNPAMKALDFGCGPGPAIDYILQEHNINCDNYDPFFFPDGIKLTQYDLIFATECIEHFHHPKIDFEKIMKLLAPEGYLSIMTELHPGFAKMADWYYIKDPTHVTFLSKNTMQWLAINYQLKIIFSDENRVTIFQKA